MKLHINLHMPPSVAQTQSKAGAGIGLETSTSEGTAASTRRKTAPQDQTDLAVTPRIKPTHFQRIQELVHGVIVRGE